MGQIVSITGTSEFFIEDITLAKDKIYTIIIWCGLIKDIAFTKGKDKVLIWWWVKDLTLTKFYSK